MGENLAGNIVDCLEELARTRKRLNSTFTQNAARLIQQDLEKFRVVS